MKRLSNQDIAERLEEMGILYEIAGVQFKPRAYERAASVIAGYGEEVADIYKEGGKKALDGIPGVGKGIAEHIESLLKTGTFPEYEKLHRKYPVQVRELVSVEGVGPKTVKLLWKALGIKTLYQLRVAAKQGKLAKVKGLGKKTEENILESIKFLSAEGDRKIDIARYELRTAIRMLSDDTYFNVVMFSYGVRVWMMTMVPATKPNRENAIAWLKTIPAWGGTNTFDAVERAFQIQGPGNDKKRLQGADTFFLVSDGRPSVGRIIQSQEILDEVTRLNRSRRVRINTIAVGKEENPQDGTAGVDPKFLKDLAEQNFGQSVWRK